jgi:hypothetical protein
MRLLTPVEKRMMSKNEWTHLSILGCD